MIAAQILFAKGSDPGADTLMPDGLDGLSGLRGRMVDISKTR